MIHIYWFVQVYQIKITPANVGEFIFSETYITHLDKVTNNKNIIPFFLNNSKIKLGKAINRNGNHMWVTRSK